MRLWKGFCLVENPIRIFDFSPETDYPSLKWHLPFHSWVFKWGDWEAVWVFLMCRNGDCYLLHTALLDGQNTLYINAFLVIPSCMKWTLWGIIHTLPYMRGGQERIKKKKERLGFLIQVEWKADRHPERSPLGLIITGFSAVIDEKWLGGSFVHSNITIFFHQNTFFFVTSRTGNWY